MEVPLLKCLVVVISAFQSVPRILWILEHQPHRVHLSLSSTSAPQESGNELFPVLRHAQVALHGAPPCQASPRGGIPIVCHMRTLSPLLHALHAMPFGGGGRCGY